MSTLRIKSERTAKDAQPSFQNYNTIKSKDSVVTENAY